jgi:L-amino acid N-acyltransferase YncA
MENKFTIRLITEKDAGEVLEIYKPYVQDTIISFEYEVPSLEEFTQRIKAYTSEYPWLVCLLNGKIIGYAYASKHRDRTAYQWSVDSAVYLSPAIHRKGIGRILYESLFSILRLQGYFNVYAGISLPNEKSIRFHETMGFEKIGIYKKTGYKHGSWHDTAWFQLQLVEHKLNPSIPGKISELADTSLLQSILKTANEKAGMITP